MGYSVSCGSHNTLFHLNLFQYILRIRLQQQQQRKAKIEDLLTPIMQHARKDVDDVSKYFAYL